MTGNTEEAASVAYRKRRVRRIKRIIVGTCIALLILPTILTIILMIKVFSLEKEVAELQAGRLELEQQTAELKEAAITSEPTKVPEKKKVYLTFDDGPGSRTEEILDILKENEIKATFFVTGKAGDEAEKIYKKIVKGGHTLGMHSYSHIYDEIYESKETFSKDFKKLYDYLHDVTGYEAQWYRFPGGSTSEHIQLPLETFTDVLESKNVRYMDWNVISPDISNPSAKKEQIASGIAESVSQFDTSVVLLYDSADRPVTLKALPLIIEKLKKENYELLPLDDDTPLVRHNH